MVTNTTTRRKKPMPFAKWITTHKITLRQGAHGGSGPADLDGCEVCIMEADALYRMHELRLPDAKFGDNIPDVSPAVNTLMIGWNDKLPTNELRAKWLTPLVSVISNTATSKADETNRGYIAADCAVRVIASLAMDSAGLTEQAVKLRELKPITDKEAASNAAIYASNAAGNASNAAIYASNAAYWDTVLCPVLDTCIRAMCAVGMETK